MDLDEDARECERCSSSGGGRMYLSTVLYDFSRCVIAWKLCTSGRAGDVAVTLQLIFKSSGCDQAEVLHKPKLRRDNGPSQSNGGPSNIGACSTAS